MLPKKAKTWELSGPHGAGFTWWYINSAFWNGQTLSLLDWSLNPVSMLHYNMYFMYFTYNFLDREVSIWMLKMYNTDVDRSNGPPYKGHGEAVCFGSQHTQDWIYTWLSVQTSGFELGLLWAWMDSSYGLRSSCLRRLTDLLQKVQGW